MKEKKTAGRTAAITVLAVTLAAVIYIMFHHYGLQDGLDFGAGAYYYADIPDFEKYLRWDSFKESLPYWVYVLLFLLWGALMYGLWVWVDNKNNTKK